MKQISIDVSDRLHKDFKVYCISKGVSMKEFLTLFIKARVSQSKKKTIVRE